MAQQFLDAMRARVPRPHALEPAGGERRAAASGSSRSRASAARISSPSRATRIVLRRGGRAPRGPPRERRRAGSRRPAPRTRGSSGCRASAPRRRGGGRGRSRGGGRRRSGRDGWPASPRRQAARRHGGPRLRAGSARRTRCPSAPARPPGRSRNSCSSALRSPSPQLPIHTSSLLPVDLRERAEQRGVGGLMPDLDPARPAALGRTESRITAPKTSDRVVAREVERADRLRRARRPVMGVVEEQHVVVVGAAASADRADQLGLDPVVDEDELRTRQLGVEVDLSAGRRSGCAGSGRRRGTPHRGWTASGSCEQLAMLHPPAGSSTSTSCPRRCSSRATPRRKCALP